jgi:hypothetical protein
MKGTVIKSTLVEFKTLSTVETRYIFVHFIIGYEKNPAELQLLKKYGCDRLP